MIPAITAARLTGAARRSALPLLVLGPSLGTSATTLWGDCAARLTDAFDVLAWDLPGHGHNRSVPDEPLHDGRARARRPAGRRRRPRRARRRRWRPSTTPATRSAGASASSSCSTRPRRVRAAVLLCTGARIGTPRCGTSASPRSPRPAPRPWSPRRRSAGSAPGFLDRHPDRASALLHALQDTADLGYTRVCAALADFDVRSRLAEVERAGARRGRVCRRRRPAGAGACPGRRSPGRPLRRARRRRPPRARRGSRAGRRPAARAPAGRGAGRALGRAYDAGMRRPPGGPRRRPRRPRHRRHHRLHPRLPGAASPSTPGARSGPGPGSTGAAAP